MFLQVVIVTQGSQWLINDFLGSPSSDQFVNLLVVADPSLQLDMFNEVIEMFGVDY